MGAGTRRYCYDGNGNLASLTVASGTGSISYDSATWWVANLPRRISEGGTAAFSDFYYGPNRERIRQFARKNSTTTESTAYVGGVFERVLRVVSGVNTTEHTHYVRGGGGETVAIVRSVDAVRSTRYPHRDHLGSVVALTNESGAVVERYSFDPWGKRRDPATWATPAPGTFSFDPALSDRGYTGHEHLDHVGLVNMNGRVYDPEVGKFLSADPTTQFPESTQGWNRYAYAGNNPLSFVDPSGFNFFKSLMRVVGIAINFVPGFQGWGGALIKGFLAGFLMSGGDFQAGMLGALGAGLFMGTHGLSNLGTFGHSLAKGIVGGGLQSAGGGRFRDGFLGTFVGGVLGEQLQGIGGESGTGGISNLVKRVVRDAMVGGVATELAGGKFKNGAATAAFARLYNDEATRRMEERRDRKLYLVAEGPDKLLDTGHAFIGGIGVDGDLEAWGFYPKDRNLGALVNGVGQGQVRDNTDLFEAALAGDPHYRMREFLVTDAQYDDAVTFMKSYDRSDYGVATRNCVHAALSSLHYAGVITATFPVVTPSRLFHAMEPAR